ncbi:MAG: DUF4149 domain-containing protein, partial [Planctomycetota bacterium]|nr:DUF4149 domain-containing protein [Planctomycetota bacterium]
MKRFIFSFVYWLQYLTLAVWVGTLVAVPVFAIKIFTFLDEDRLTAGRIIGSSLNLLGGIQIACGLVLILAVASLLLFVPASGGGPRWRTFQAGKIILPLIMFFMTAYLIFSTGPRMQHLRENSPQTEFDDWSGPDKDEFDILHKRYTNFSKGTLLGGLVLFLLLAVDSA